MVEQLHDTIYRIEVPLPDNPLRNLGSYLIKSRGQYLLIDTGFNRPECLEALASGLAEIGVDRTHMDIYLTHLHSDHTGLVGHLVSDNTAVYLHERDMALFEGITTQDPAIRAEINRNNIAEGYPEDVLRASMAANPAVRFAPDRPVVLTPVTNGQKLRVGDIELTCIHTPGHTPGHCCLYMVGERILFTGDHVLYDITPNIACWPGVEDSLGDYLLSLEHSKSLDVAHAYAGHRNNRDDFYGRVDALIQHHRERLSEVLRIVEDEPGLTGYEVAARMHWSIRAKDWDDFPPGQKWFAVGEASAHLRYLLLRDELRCEARNGIRRYDLPK